MASFGIFFVVVILNCYYIHLGDLIAVYFEAEQMVSGFLVQNSQLNTPVHRCFLMRILMPTST